MKPSNEQKKAQKLLALRQSGLSYGVFYRRSWIFYAFIMLLLGYSLYRIIRAEADILEWVVFGLAVGAAARDLAWGRRMVKVWPFEVKIIDWDKVKRLADGETVD